MSQVFVFLTLTQFQPENQKKVAENFCNLPFVIELFTIETPCKAETLYIYKALGTAKS